MSVAILVQLYTFPKLALDEGEWLTSHTSHLTLVKEPPVSIKYKFGQALEPGGYMKEKNLFSLAGIEPWISQPIT